MKKQFICIPLIILFYATNLTAQFSFEINLNSDHHEYPSDFIQDSNNDFVGIIWKSDYFGFERQSYIYKISPVGDTVSYAFLLQDTVLNLYDIIEVSKSPIKYIVAGTGYVIGDDPRFRFSYFMKIDEDMNIIWSKTYQLFDESHIEYWSNIIQIENNNYLFAGSSDDPRTMFLLQLSELGDSIAYRKYEGDSAGTAQDLTYNYDSTAYWLHTHMAHYNPTGPESQCVELNFNLEQTKVMYYPRWFSSELRAKLLPDRNLVAGARYWYSQSLPRRKYLGAFKLDSTFYVIDSCYLTHPDTSCRGGFKTLDYYYPSRIYLGGEHNYNMGTWVTEPSWFIVALMDEDLNIIRERYIGGDAFYDLKTVTATSDGGVLVSGTRYDYLTQNEEHDVIIIKLDSMDFTVGQQDHKQPFLVNAIVYPNPGQDEVYLRTSFNNSKFELYDLDGSKVLYKNIIHRLTKLEVNELKPGVYSWSLTNNQQVVETGKWIKK